MTKDHVEKIMEYLYENGYVDLVVCDAVAEMLEKQMPKILTLDELKQMHGKPVYLQLGCEPEGVWAICDVYKDTFAFYSLLGESNPDADLYNLEYDDPDGHFGLHVLGWRAFDKEPEVGDEE